MEQIIAALALTIFVVIFGYLRIYKKNKQKKQAENVKEEDTDA